MIEYKEKVKTGHNSVISFFLLSKSKGFSSALLCNTEKREIKRSHRGSTDPYNKEMRLSRMGKRIKKSTVKEFGDLGVGEEMTLG